MEANMVKAQSHVVDIMCNLELIYPPSFFDVMIHLVIHLPQEALEGGPIPNQWMYPFERYMKKLKNYVRNKAKPEGSIVEGYVAKEALTFSSHYFRDVTTKFNRLDRNVDCPPPTCQFQVFRSICKSIGKRSVIRFDHQELKKVIWYVLHNSPEIDTYRAKFKSEFPNQDIKEEFPGWFGSQIHQRYIDKDPGVSASGELFALACGPTSSPISVKSCVINGVRFVVRSRDERRTTQNIGICSPGEKDGEMYYGQLQEILEFSYMSFKIDRGDHGVDTRLIKVTLGEDRHGVPMHTLLGTRSRCERKRDEEAPETREESVLDPDLTSNTYSSMPHTADVDEVKKENKQLRKEINMLIKVVRNGDKMSQLLTQLQSEHEVGSGNESGGGGDDEAVPED
ncbi:hypothetical protein Tco_0779973 [Tanacetum coccineum]